ncbi:hypothetical protein Q6284_29015, partial [Klebsiella pneumoniae]|uniref:hypothetical protein n=1 Tax=Klebsiella pneumoniae TaxID=573 RepID=UPI0027300F36
LLGFAFGLLLVVLRLAFGPQWAAEGGPAAGPSKAASLEHARNVFSRMTASTPYPGYRSADH